MCPKCLSFNFKKNGHRKVNTFYLSGSHIKVISRYLCKDCGHTWSPKVQFYSDEIYLEIVDLLIKKNLHIVRYLKSSVRKCKAIYHMVQ